MERRDAGDGTALAGVPDTSPVHKGFVALMPFNSFPFLLFVVVFFALYFVLRGRTRLLWSIAASCLYYAWWDWRFLFLLGGSTLLAFWCGRMIGRSRPAHSGSFWLWLCVTIHLLALCFFKYLTPAWQTVKWVLSWAGVEIPLPSLNPSLPNGISFYTFTALSYVLDVYRGKIASPELDLSVFAAHQCLFPHLVAGPIVRASSLLPQIKADPPLDWARVWSGIEMITWGFVLKLCLADNSALFVDPRFGQPQLYSSLSLCLAVLAYALQIYGDFAGYSLIAIGLARMMGYDYGANFDRPYFSSSITEFWRRWHISLGSWFRDYVFIPLEVATRHRRNAALRTSSNLIMLMLLVGLWHGATWNFLLWGLLYGVCLAVENIISPVWRTLDARVRIPRAVSGTVSTLAVFAVVCLGWILFRTPNLMQAATVIRGLLAWKSTSHLDFGGMKYHLLRIGMVACIVLAVDYLAGKPKLRLYIDARVYARVALVALGLLLILFTGSFASNSFVYSQF